MSRYRFLIFCSFANLLIVIFFAEHLPGANARWFGRKKNRAFHKGTGSSIPISWGDTVITSLKPNRIKVVPPYRWMFAVNDRQVIHFLPKLSKIFKRVKPVLINVRTKYPKVKMVNRGKKPGHIGLAGLYIAALMLESGKEFYFNLFFCNCKHYVEYLSLGKVKGRWYKVLYNRMSKRCPLRAALDGSGVTLKKIYDSKEFTLEDKKGDKTHLKIAEWPHYIPGITFSYAPAT